jgi:DNA-binding transcriptional ArsR family regulator
MTHIERGGRTSDGLPAHHEKTMALQHPLPDEVIELIARRFRLLGDPTRIKLLDTLHDGDATVHELTEAVGSTQQNISKHLSLLSDAGIVGRSKDGGPTRYRVVDDGIWALCEEVCGTAERQLESLRLALHGATR